MEHAVARDAGIVDEDIDGAVGGLDLGDALGAGIKIGHVPFIARDSSLLREGSGGFIIAGIIGGDDIALRLQCLGNCRTDTARSTCHYCNPSHILLPVIFG